MVIELSKKSKKFKNENDVIDTYKTFTKKSYSIRTLHYIAKRDDPKEYNKIIYKIDINEREIINPVYIDNRYLLDLNYNLDNNKDLFTAKISDFFNNDYHCLSIKSPCYSGKTDSLKKIIKKFKQKKILFISYRISLSIDLMNSFKHFDFKTYWDKDYSADRLIIQAESLTRISQNNFIDEYTEQIKKYDLITIDETESVLHQFSSPTFKNQSKQTFEYFTELLKFSNKCIFLDGDISDRGYSFINCISNKQINIVNNIKMEKKIYNVVNERNQYITSIINDVDNNKKIAIISQSRCECENFYKYSVTNLKINPLKFIQA